MTNKIGILCLIGAISAHLILGNVYTWGNINTYYCSYLRYIQKKAGKKPTIEYNDVYFLSPITFAFKNYLMILSGFIEPKIGIRYTVLISMALLSTAYTMLYFFTNFFLVAVSMSLCGIGSSLTYFSVIHNCWRYFPEKKATINGLILSIFGGSTALFTTIADLIINPDEEQTTDDGFYSDAVSSRVKDFLFWMMIIVYVLSAISITFSIPYKNPDKDLKQLQTEEKEIPKETETEKEKEEPLIKSKDVQDPEPIQKVLKSRQFPLLIIFTFCTSFYGLSMGNLNRAFGVINKLDPKMLMWLSRVYSIMNCILRFFWGLVVDKIGFFIPYIALLIDLIGVSSLFYLCRTNNTLFFIINMFAVFAASGGISLPFALTGKKYGQKNGLILVGAVSMANATAALSAPLIIKFAIKENSDYLYFFIIVAVLGCVSLVLIFFIDDKKFDYKTGQSVINKEEENSHLEEQMDDMGKMVSSNRTSTASDIPKEEAQDKS